MEQHEDRNRSAHKILLDPFNCPFKTMSSMNPLITFPHHEGDQSLSGQTVATTATTASWSGGDSHCSEDSAHHLGHDVASIATSATSSSFWLQGLEVLTHHVEDLESDHASYKQSEARDYVSSSSEEESVGQNQHFNYPLNEDELQDDGDASSRTHVADMPTQETEDSTVDISLEPSVLSIAMEDGPQNNQEPILAITAQRDHDCFALFGGIMRNPFRPFGDLFHHQPEPFLVLEPSEPEESLFETTLTDPATANCCATTVDANQELEKTAGSKIHTTMNSDQYQNCEEEAPCSLETKGGDVSLGMPHGGEVVQCFLETKGEDTSSMAPNRIGEEEAQCPLETKVDDAFPTEEEPTGATDGIADELEKCGVAQSSYEEGDDVVLHVYDEMTGPNQGQGDTSFEHNDIIIYEHTAVDRSDSCLVFVSSSSMASSTDAVTESLTRLQQSRIRNRFAWTASRRDGTEQAQPRKREARSKQVTYQEQKVDGNVEVWTGDTWLLHVTGWSTVVKPEESVIFDSKVDMASFNSLVSIATVPKYEKAINPPLFREFVLYPPSHLSWTNTPATRDSSASLVEDVKSSSCMSRIKLYGEDVLSTVRAVAAAYEDLQPDTGFRFHLRMESGYCEFLSSDEVLSRLEMLVSAKPPSNGIADQLKSCLEAPAQENIPHAHGRVKKVGFGLPSRPLSHKGLLKAASRSISAFMPSRGGFRRVSPMTDSGRADLGHFVVERIEI
jgi:hypothetical protein